MPRRIFRFTGNSRAAKRRRAAAAAAAALASLSVSVPDKRRASSRHRVATTTQHTRQSNNNNDITPGKTTATRSTCSTTTITRHAATAATSVTRRAKRLRSTTPIALAVTSLVTCVDHEMTCEQVQQDEKFDATPATDAQGPGLLKARCIPSDITAVDNITPASDDAVNTGSSDAVETTPCIAVSVSTAVPPAAAATTAAVQCTTIKKRRRPCSVQQQPVLPTTANKKSIGIVCGGNTAQLFLGVSSSDRCRDKCVHFESRWLSPNEFQAVSGRSAAKDWKRTIKHAGQCIKTLLRHGVLVIDGPAAGCHCRQCASQLTEVIEGDCLQHTVAVPLTLLRQTTTSDDVTKIPPPASKRRKKQTQQQNTGLETQLDKTWDRKLQICKLLDSDYQQPAAMSVKNEEQESASCVSVLPYDDATTNVNCLPTSKLSHLSRVIDELKQSKMKRLHSNKLPSSDATENVSCKRPLVNAKNTAELHQLALHTADSANSSNKTEDQPSYSAFYGLSSAQLSAISPAHLATMSAPYPLCPPPYIFMGFPLHPQLLQSYPAQSGQTSTHASHRQKHDSIDRSTVDLNCGSTITALDLTKRSASACQVNVMTSHNDSSSKSIDSVDKFGVLDLSTK